MTRGEVGRDREANTENNHGDRDNEEEEEIKIIIVEGMDGSGKTTLVNYLAYRLKVQVEKSPGPVGIEEYWAWIDSTIRRERAGEKWIYDRHAFFSDQVYSILRKERNHQVRSPVAVSQMRALINCNPTVIYCRPFEEAILDGLLDKDHMEGVPENWVDLLRRYDELMTEMKQYFNVVYYNWEVTPIDFLVEKVQLTRIR